MAKTVCPNCQRADEVPEFLAKMAVNCKSCGTRVQVVAADGSIQAVTRDEPAAPTPQRSLANLVTELAKEPPSTGLSKIETRSAPNQPISTTPSDGYVPRRDGEAKSSSTATKPTVLVGIAMMAGAVVWFVAGLALDRIFFYPPILLVLGFISLVKGLRGEE